VGDQPLGDTADVGAAHVDDERGIGVGEARSVQVECAVVDGLTASDARSINPQTALGFRARRWNTARKPELTNGERGGK
jgi:hypothetical protein